MHHSYNFLYCVTVPSVLGAPSSAHTCIPRQIDSPDCLTVSNLCTYTDLGSRGGGGGGGGGILMFNVALVPTCFDI